MHKPTLKHWDYDIGLFDVHTPVHDVNKVRIAMNVAKFLQPKRIIWGGDLFDLSHFGKFEIDRRNITAIQRDLNDGASLFEQARFECPKSEQFFIMGNHEDRLEKLKNRLPYLGELDCLKSENLFKCNDYGVKVLQYGEGLEIGGWIYTHGTKVSNQAAYTARAECELWGMSGVSGHTHRAGVYNQTRYSGTKTWIEAGCLCSLNPSYIKGTANWQSALVVGRRDRDTNDYQVNLYQFTGDKLWFGDLLFQ